MGDLNVQQRKFVVKAGMTVDDIKNSKEATVLQKKYASAFDTDKNGFSQKEADLFNATTFSEKGDGTVIFWTRQKDGTKKGTKFDSKDNNIQFKPEDEVKPYVKKVAVKKAEAKKDDNISFFDEAWSGHQIAKLTGDNAFTAWLQNKDKVCTDGNDDGKIGFWEGAKSFAKGLIGGIPKAIINHPVTTAVTVGAGAAAVALTGGAILPVLGAVGVAAGVGMAGYGGYKAVTAETDGEAKQALETMGMGITTTALSVAAADKALEKAAEAGVKSAQVSEDAGIVGKTVQMFKAIPESLTKSKEWTMSYIKGTPVNIELADGTKQVKVKGKLVEETFADGGYKKYDASGTKIIEGDFKIGDRRVVYESFYKKEYFPDGNYKICDRDGSILFEEGNTVTGEYKKYHFDSVTEEGNKITGDYKKYGIPRSRTQGYSGRWGITEEGNKITGDYNIYYEYDYDKYEKGIFKGKFRKTVSKDSPLKEINPYEEIDEPVTIRTGTCSSRKTGKSFFDKLIGATDDGFFKDCDPSSFGEPMASTIRYMRSEYSSGGSGGPGLLSLTSPLTIDDYPDHTWLYSEYFMRGRPYGR